MLRKTKKNALFFLVADFQLFSYWADFVLILYIDGPLHVDHDGFCLERPVRSASCTFGMIFSQFFCVFVVMSVGHSKN